MRTKLQRLILNNLNKNKNEIEARVWRWFLTKNEELLNKFQFFKPLDIHLTKEFLRNSLFRTKRYKTAKKSKNKNTISPRKFRRICLVTGRSKGIFRFTKLSRIQIKRVAKLRLISGLRLSSW